MHLSAALIEHVFLISVVLFLLCECFLTARQIIAAERSVGSVPEGFENRLSLAAHKKAAAYTTESALANLVLSFIGADFAVLMTVGHGFNIIAAFLETLSDTTLISISLCGVNVSVTKFYGCFHSFCCFVVINKPCSQS